MYQYVLLALLSGPSISVVARPRVPDVHPAPPLIIRYIGPEGSRD